MKTRTQRMKYRIDAEYLDQPRDKENTATAPLTCFPHPSRSHISKNGFRDGEDDDKD